MMKNTIITKKYATELISNEVQELISYRPHWIIRKGNALFFIMLALLLSSTWLIKYPDVIKGSIKLTAVNAPKLLLSKTEGKLEKLLVSNEQAVKQGQLLAFLQSTALHGQVLQLQSWINNIEPYIMRDSLEVLLTNPLPIFNQLGEIQTPYQDFQNTFNETLQILANGFYQQKKQALQRFHSELFNLKSKIEAWVQQYVIIAPEDGMVLFTSFLQEHQSLSAGQELFYVQPKESNYYGQLLVSQTGLGKIKTGQKVLVRVESYPSSEFGYMIGTVNYISNIPNARDSFLIKVDLPTGLKTNYNKMIFFRNDLSAQAEVMTDNRRVLDRILGELRNITRR